MYKLYYVIYNSRYGDEDWGGRGEGKNNGAEAVSPNFTVEGGAPREPVKVKKVKTKNSEKPKS